MPPHRINIFIAANADKAPASRQQTNESFPVSRCRRRYEIDFSNPRRNTTRAATIAANSVAVASAAVAVAVAVAAAVAFAVAAAGDVGENTSFRPWEITMVFRRQEKAAS